MSRISTPTGLGVNPNVPMADMQAPTIVYGAQGMDESALLQYEQLTNVLQAGVQAAGTFLEVSILDRKMKAEIAEQSAKLRSDQFRVGLEEAIRLDKSTQVGDRVKYDNVRSYLSRWDYETLIADDQVLFQRTLGGYEEKDLEYQREFNSKGLVSVLRTRADAIRGRAEGGDPEAMRLMASIKDDDTALDLLMGLLTPEEQANFKTITQVNWDLYRDKMSVVLSQFVQEGSKYSAKIAAAANDRKTDMMIEISGDDLADQFISDTSSSYRPDGSQKSAGWVTGLKNSKGEAVTEYSITVDGQLIPLINPDLSTKELNEVIKASETGDMPSDAIIEKSIAFARKRIQEGKSPFSDVPFESGRDLKADVLSNINNARSVLASINPTITEAQRDAAVGKMLERAAVGLMERGTPEQILEFRDILGKDDVDLDPTKKKNLIKTLEDAVFDKVNTTMSMDLNSAVDANDADAVRTVESRLDAMGSNLITETDRKQLRERIGSAYRAIGRNQISKLSANMQQQQLSPQSIQEMIASPSAKDTALADYQDMLMEWRIQGKDAYGNPIEIMSVDDVAKSVSQYETILDSQMRRAVAPSVTNTINETLSMFRGVPTKQAIKDAGDVFMPAAKQIGGLDQGRFDVIFSQFKDNLAVKGILPGTTEYGNAMRELSRQMQRDVFPRSMLLPGGQRAVGGYEAAAVQRINDYLQKTAPGSPLISDLSPMDTDTPAISTMKGNARVTVEIARLRFASMATDSTGSRYSTAISDFRASLNSLVGPNLQARIPVEVYDAYKIWNDPRINREEVFGTDSPNGTRIARLMSAMDIVKDRPKATLEDLISAAGLMETFDPGNLGWKAITRNEQEMNMHSRRFEEITKGVTIKDSTLWLRREYATNFERLSTDNFGDQAAARAQVTELLSERVIVANGSVLPQADIGSDGAAYVEDMAKVLTGRDDAAFVVVGYDNAGRYLYALRDQNGNRIVNDANGNPIEPVLYTTDRVYPGQEGMFSLTSDEFVTKVKRFHATEGIRTPSQRTGRPKPAVKTKQEELQERFNFGTME